MFGLTRKSNFTALATLVDLDNLRKREMMASYEEGDFIEDLGDTDEDLIKQYNFYDGMCSRVGG